MNPDDAAPRPWNEIPNRKCKASPSPSKRLPDDAIATLERCTYCKQPMWTRDIAVEDICDECDHVSHEEIIAQRRAQPGQAARQARSPLESSGAARIPQPFTQSQQNTIVRYDPFASRNRWRPRTGR